MKSKEKLKMVLEKVQSDFEKEQYELSLLGIQEAGRIIISVLNSNKH